MPRTAVVVNGPSGLILVGPINICYFCNMQLRAPVIMTMTGPTLQDHCIGISEDRIQYILPISEAPHDTNIIDLPHTTLLPGLVNAHCHMDLSHLRNKVPFTGSFADWIRHVVAMREHLTEDDVIDAARELQQSGVTTICDHVGAFSELSYIMDTPFRKRLFFEVIGVSAEMAAENSQRQEERALMARRDGVEAFTTPHATYSVHPEIFKSIAHRQGQCSIHCAESAEEWEMFTEGRGKLHNFIQERGELNFALAHSPLHYLAQNNLLPTRQWLAVHCNTLTDDDITLLKKSHATVVHCPRSHRFFSHPPFPIEKLRAAGVPIAIGTDSLASCPNFNFLEELQALREEFSTLNTDDILQMAVYQSCIAPGSTADIIGLTQQGTLLNSSVSFRMFNGQHVA